jgi:hypothetical protein
MDSTDEIEDGSTASRTLDNPQKRGLIEDKVNGLHQGLRSGHKLRGAKDNVVRRYLVPCYEIRGFDLP